MRAYIFLAAAAALCLGAPAIAQNAKGTDAANQTTTTTNPIGTSINPAPSASGKPKPAPNMPINRGNSSATKNSQFLNDPKKGLFSK